MKKHHTFLFALLLLCSCSPGSQGDGNANAPQEPASTAAAVTPAAAPAAAKTVPEPIALEGVENLYRVSPDLYRSGQPKAKGFNALYQLGVRSVFNLREFHKDDSKAKKSGLTLYHHSMAAGSMTESDIEQCLLILRHAPKPVLVHCMHGSDRTGTVVAAYRIVEQGWDVEEAISELTEKRFGYHAFWYPRIPELIRSIDWAAMRARLDASSK